MYTMGLAQSLMSITTRVYTFVLFLKLAFRVLAHLVHRGLIVRLGVVFLARHLDLANLGHRIEGRRSNVAVVVNGAD